MITCVRGKMIAKGRVRSRSVDLQRASAESGVAAKWGTRTTVISL